MRAILPLLFLLPAVLVAQEYGDAGSERDRLATIHIRQFKAAAFLRIDGQARDWQRLTLIHRADDNPAEDLEPALAIRTVGVAPTAGALNVLVVTGGKLPQNNGTVWLTLDTGGEEDFDGAVGVCWSKPSLVDVYRKGKGKDKVRVDGEGIVAAQNAGVLEVRIPWQTLAAAVPEEDRGTHPFALPPRAWVRVRACTWHHQEQPSHREDRGVTAACPLLTRELPDLDVRAREDGWEPVVVGCPLRGRWYVSQGAFAAYSHGTKWAWDLVRVDDAHYRSPQDGTDAQPTVQNIYAYGQPLIACADGKVLTAVDAFPDQPLKQVGDTSKVNTVSLRLPDGKRASYVHLAPGSVTVARDAAVKTGQVIGAVGNSGATTSPHLHFQVYEGKDTVPAAFAKVEVRLNRSDGDPWKRFLKSWEPRDGWFVVGPAEE